MFRIQSENELKECFREQDREELILGPEVKFPMVARDYLAWVEPSGNRTYLVFQDASFKGPLGIVFRRVQSLGPGVAAMCEWCHSVRSGDEVGLLTVKTHSNRRIAISLCRDLGCAENVRSGPGVHDFPTTASVQERVRRVLAKMADFARRELV
jgi:hypothetical protein